jgi:hypothetical protein
VREIHSFTSLKKTGPARRYHVIKKKVVTHPQSRAGRSNLGMLVTCKRQRGSIINAVPEGKAAVKTRAGALRRDGRAVVVSTVEMSSEVVSMLLPPCAETDSDPLNEEPSVFIKPSASIGDDEANPMAIKNQCASLRIQASTLALRLPVPVAVEWALPH